MDQFMENFLNFEGFGPPTLRRDVPAATLDQFKGRLPDMLIEYWRQYGWCAYAKGLLWTVNPADWDDELEDWIGDLPFMEQDAYHVIARTAFGELILWGERSGQSLKIVASRGIIVPTFNPDRLARVGPDRAMQLFFSSASRDLFDEKDDDGAPLFERACSSLGPLDHDSMYGFVPALALGGRASIDRLQRLDAHTHIQILAEVSQRHVLEDAAQAARK